MAYISAEEVADIRARLKEAFPLAQGWKFSVSKSSGSLGVNVGILRSPVPIVAYDFDQYAHDDDTPRSALQAKCMGRTVNQESGGINHYWFRDHYTPETVAVLESILGIVLRDHWDKSDIMTDYFHCSWYPHFEVGKGYSGTLEQAKPEQIAAWEESEMAADVKARAAAIDAAA